MPGRRSKYSKETTQQIEFSVMDVLNNSSIALTIDQIKANSLYLAQQTPQKIARVLNTLNDAGLVQKAKSKSLNKMVYKSTFRMREEGYEV